MRKPTADVVEAMARIAARPEGALVLEYLQSSMTEIQSALVQMEDPNRMRMLQGQAQMLGTVLQFWKP